jgi:hypothetical protein
MVLFLFNSSTHKSLHFYFFLEYRESTSSSRALISLLVLPTTFLPHCMQLSFNNLNVEATLFLPKLVIKAAF